MRIHSRPPRGWLLILLILLSACVLLKQNTSNASKESCVECHTKISPQIVSDWELSLHSENEIDCISCHGAEHMSAEDVKKAGLATPDTCAECHDEQVLQFKKGKHALAWAAMKAMPTFHWQPMALTEGIKGCGGCHKHGLKSDEEIKRLIEQGYGFGLSAPIF